MSGDLTITYNNVNGSDANSGCGPSTPVTGNNAYSGDGIGGGTQTIINVSGDSPDLSGIVADDILYLAVTGDNRGLFEIVSVDNSAKTITVSDAPTTSINIGSEVSWSIGGKRKTYSNNASRLDTKDGKDGWTFYFEDAQPAQSSMTFTSGASNTTPITILGAGPDVSSLSATSSNHCIQPLNRMIIKDIKINTTSFRSAIYGNAGHLKLINIETSGVNDSDNGFFVQSGGAVFIYNCKFSGHGGSAIASNNGRVWFMILNSYFNNNTTGINLFAITSLSSFSIIGCVINNHTTYGINLTTGAFENVSIAECVINDVSGGPCININYTASGEDLVNISNCILSNGSTYGIVDNIGNSRVSSINNAFYNNSTGNISGSPLEINSIDLSQNPFEDPNNGNLNLNLIPGGGATLRALEVQL